MCMSCRSTCPSSKQLQCPAVSHVLHCNSLHSYDCCAGMHFEVLVLPAALAPLASMPTLKADGIWRLLKEGRIQKNGNRNLLNLKT